MMYFVNMLILHLKHFTKVNFVSSGNDYLINLCLPNRIFGLKLQNPVE